MTELQRSASASEQQHVMYRKSEKNEGQSLRGCYSGGGVFVCLAWMWAVAGGFRAGMCSLLPPSGSGTCLVSGWCQEPKPSRVRNGRTFFSPSRRGGPSEAGAGDRDDVELASRASVHRSSNREIVQICFPPTRTLSTPSPISDFTASLIDCAFCFCFHSPALQ